ncbi:MAG: hypothetical protein AAFY26_23490 [Cyanobacteria bacterium J06638_22]
MARAIGETVPLLFTTLFSQYGINGLWNPIASLFNTYSGVQPRQAQKWLCVRAAPTHNRT